MEYNRLSIKESKDTKEIDENRMIEIKRNAGRIDLGNGAILESRARLEFGSHAIYLPLSYDWVMGTDSDEQLCLVPLKKKDYKE